MRYLLTILLLFSCASEKPKGKTEAEILYKEAEQLIKDERFILATEKLNQLKTQFPYSFYATPAELLQADVLYLQENYTDAAAAFLLFKDFHPKHERSDYVLFKIAEAYYNQVPDTFDRDLDSAVEAVKYYKELLKLHSYSKFKKDAQAKIDKCNMKLQEKEKYIADFYFKTEVYQAARWRYLDILEHFSDTKIRSHSMLRVIESSYLMKEYAQCSEYLKSYSPLVSKTDKKRISAIGQKCNKKL